MKYQKRQFYYIIMFIYKVINLKKKKSSVFVESSFLLKPEYHTFTSSTNQMSWMLKSINSGNCKYQDIKFFRSISKSRIFFKYKPLAKASNFLVSAVVMFKEVCANSAGYKISFLANEPNFYHTHCLRYFLPPSHSPFPCALPPTSLLFNLQKTVTVKDISMDTT